MAQPGKSSLRRSKPSYVFSIIGVSLVLLIMGIMGWFVLNFNQVSNALKEEIPVSVYLRTSNKDTIAKLQQYISSQSYAKDVKYINKDAAKAIWNKDNNEDWSKILDYNPFPESIDFYTRALYVNNDSLAKISANIMALYGSSISELKYQQGLVSTLTEKTKIFGIAFLVISIILCIIVIFSIDNTIRLAMYSNRFLIKTMQMVGATRGFIAKPLNIRAIVNGLISAGIAIAILFGILQWAEDWIPWLRVIRTLEFTLILFGGMILMGVGISVFSTHRSVIKYLKMKLDDLY